MRPFLLKIGGNDREIDSRLLNLNVLNFQRLTIDPPKQQSSALDLSHNTPEINLGPWENLDHRLYGEDHGQTNVPGLRGICRYGD